jgi:hypothetical protein
VARFRTTEERHQRRDIGRLANAVNFFTFRQTFAYFLHRYGLKTGAHFYNLIQSLGDGSAGYLKLIVEPGGCVRAAVGGKILILADSGVQRGSDIAKLIGAGADAVLAGRTFLWALAAGGANGVQRATRILLDELRAFMVFAGSVDLDALRQARWLDDP